MELVSEKLEGYIEHVIYHSENGYTVFVLVSEGEEITCVGSFSSLSEGEYLELTGTYKVHPMYGDQFQVESFTSVAPRDALAMERYLGSGAIRGVGAALAARIVRRFGADTFRIIEEEPERLAEIKGISEKKAREIAVQVEEKRELRQAMLFLQQYGISVALAVKIYQKYGAEMYDKMKKILISWRMTLRAWDFAPQMRSHSGWEFIRIPTTGCEAGSSIPFCRPPERDIPAFPGNS